jgi:hypothetical protein
LPEAHADTRRPAAASGVGCGDVASHTVVEVVDGTVVADVPGVDGADVPRLLPQADRASASIEAETTRVRRIGETLPAQ